MRHHRPDQPHRGTGTVPRHLDTIVNVPAPSWDAGDPRAYSVSDTANAWRNALDATVLSVVLTVQSVGDHLRSGGSIVSVVAENPPAGGAESAIKAALSNWIAGQAAVFGTRGITINTVACGRSVQTGYEGLSRTPAPVAAEIARLALFLTTCGSPHHRPDAARQPRRAGSLRLNLSLHRPIATVGSVTIRLGLQIPNFSYGTGVEKLFRPSSLKRVRPKRLVTTPCL